METLEYSDKPTYKIYKEDAIYLATLLGGPLAAGYLCGVNFKAFGKPEMVKYCWALAILVTAITLAIVFLIPDHIDFPAMVLPISYTVCTFFLVTKYQRETIQSHLQEGGPVYKKGRALLVSLFSAVILFIGLGAYFILTDPFLYMESKTFGVLQHEILYNDHNISESEVLEMGENLEILDFFDEEGSKQVVLEKKGNMLILSVPLLEKAWINRDVVQYYHVLKEDLEMLYPGKKIVIQLCDEDMEVKKTY